MNVFEVMDKTKRKIRLTQNRWRHITIKHPYMTNYLAEVEDTIINSQNIIAHEYGDLSDYYKYFKHRKDDLKLLKVVVKYLNGDGFVLSAYFVKNIAY